MMRRAGVNAYRQGSSYQTQKLTECLCMVLFYFIYKNHILKFDNYWSLTQRNLLGRLAAQKRNMDTLQNVDYMPYEKRFFVKRSGEGDFEYDMF